MLGDIVLHIGNLYLPSLYNSRTLTRLYIVRVRRLERFALPFTDLERQSKMSGHSSLMLTFKIDAYMRSLLRSFHLQSNDVVL